MNKNQIMPIIFQGWERDEHIHNRCTSAKDQELPQK